ncbi:MAG: FtsX-like permease family protein [Thermodesulfobacteriota bacterium]|nr:FtsX-like permease family protein [Thermodesulfobacteriota bacterium]
MTAWIKIAMRNLAKNWRRSMVTSLAIALGFAAVNLFSGFTEYMYTGNREVAIFGRCGGHLMIFKKDYLAKGRIDPARYMLNPDEIHAIKKICRKIQQVILVSPQLTISGLVSNGKISTIFVAQGITPSEVDRFRSRSSIPEIAKAFEGKRLHDDKIYGAAVARGLAHMLDLKVGSDAVVFTNTIDGQMNALDMEVFQLIETDSREMNDKVMMVPFKFAQKLYYTEGADRVVLLLDKTEYTIAVRDQLRRHFSEKGLNIEIRTWKEMSQWYRKIETMFDVIFAFLFTIVFIIIVMSVVNTMSMSVIERTREIGTLRALGLKRKGVIWMFAIESSMLGVFGTIGGLILTLVGWWSIDVIRPTWIPPNVSIPVPIRIEFVPGTMLYSFFFLLFLCLLASLIPARRAAGQNVVDALGHV